MESRKLTEEEIGKVVGYFLGEKYVEKDNCYLGYHDIDGISYITVIEALQEVGTLAVDMYTESFGDGGVTAPEIFGYIRCEMKQVMPGARCDRWSDSDHCLSVTFFWEK